MLIGVENVIIITESVMSVSMIIENLLYFQGNISLPGGVDWCRECDCDYKICSVHLHRTRCEM